MRDRAFTPVPHRRELSASRKLRGVRTGFEEEFELFLSRSIFPFCFCFLYSYAPSNLK